jgi:trehalose synthase
MLSLKDFRTIVPNETLDEIYSKAKMLYGKHIVHINSTYQGGGVAEILYSLVLLMNDVGIETGWRILHGSPDFFTVTKKFHNALQGATLNLSERKKYLYLDVNDNFAHYTHLPHDCVIVHDPQPLPLIRSYRKRQPWIWRCHIDLTNPNEQMWDFLKGFLLNYDEMIVSSDKYFKKDLPIKQRVIFPAINPLSLKNKDIDEQTILKYVEKARIPTGKPIITQVSRLDPWKDPEGVLDVFLQVKEKVDCRLVLCYNLASDDPEGMEMYHKVHRKAKKYIDKGDVLFVVGNNDILVNSIQRFSSVIIQKSIKEGFCLAVTEALWKSKPVVASNVGGLPVQIEDGKNGFLLEPNDIKGFAERIIHLLKNPDEANILGEKAKETVRRKFLITRLLSNYLDMLNSIMCD